MLTKNSSPTFKRASEVDKRTFVHFQASEERKLCLPLDDRVLLPSTTLYSTLCALDYHSILKNSSLASRYIHVGGEL
jgi:hypothetical protein